MELGESTEDTARREVLEETNLTIGELQLIGVYSGSEHLIVAPNGDKFYVVVIAYSSSEYSGQLRCDIKETLDCQFFKPNNLPLPMVGSHQKIIEDYIKSSKGGKL